MFSYVFENVFLQKYWSVYHTQFHVGRAIVQRVHQSQLVLNLLCHNKKCIGLLIARAGFFQTVVRLPLAGPNAYVFLISISSLALVEKSAAVNTTVCDAF